MKIKAIIKTLQNNTLDNNTHEGYSLSKADITPSEYIDTYKSIGKKYCWWMKQIWSEDLLQKHLDDNSTKVFWIKYNEEIIGFVEIHLYFNNCSYIQYFGLFDEFINKGHGKKSLDLILNFCKNKLLSSKVFTTTNNLDHENALNVYYKCGFTLVQEHEEIWDIPLDEVEIEITERNIIWLQ